MSSSISESEQVQVRSQAPEVAQQIEALVHRAGVSTLVSRRWIRVTGDDRVRWLNGMVTNSVQQLGPGDGCYNFVLSAQGRIQGDAYIYARPDDLLIQTDASQVESLLTYLDRFIIMDDVEIAPVEERSGVLLTGPAALSLLAEIGISTSDLPPLRMRAVEWRSAQIDVVHGYSPMVDHIELWSDIGTSTALLDASTGAGAEICKAPALEALRILGGVPAYGVDISGRDLPQETSQTRALHFSKGCYLGQEIVERIRSRGNVHRALAILRLKGDPPGEDRALHLDGKPAGELTSVASVPEGIAGVPAGQVALGYVRREALERGAELRYAGGVAIPTLAANVRA